MKHIAMIMLALLCFMGIASATQAIVIGDDGYGATVRAQVEAVNVSLLPDPVVTLSLSSNRTEVHVNDTVEYNYTITAGPANLHNLSMNDSAYGPVTLPSRDLAANQSMIVLVDRVPFTAEVNMSPVTLFSDGFELGNFSKWNSASMASISNSVVHSGSNSAEFVQYGGPIAKQINYGGVLYFDFWIFVTEYDDSNVLVFKTSTPAPRKYYNLLYLGSGGSMKYHNGTSIVNLPTPTSITANEWHHIVITMNFTEQKTYWTVDGSSKGSATIKSTGGNVPETTQQLDAVYLYGAAWDASYIDDVLVSQEPYKSLTSIYPLRPMQGILVR